MVICLEQGAADLHMAQLMPLPLALSCFSKMQIGFYRATLCIRGTSHGPVSVCLPLTVTLIIISFSSPTLSFIADLKPAFLQNPSHCSLSLSSSGLTT